MLISAVLCLGASVLPGVGQRAQIADKVFLVVKEVRADSLQVSWINESQSPFLVTPPGISVECRRKVYPVIEPFAKGSHLSVAEGGMFTFWLSFPEGARPLSECILQQGGRPVIDLRKRPAPPQPQPAPIQFGQSFVVIEVSPKNPSQVLTSGYWKIANAQSQVFAPGGVLVIGDKAGHELGGTRFGYGTIVVIEGTSGKPKYRAARPGDRIVLADKVIVFGRDYGPGPFPVPPGGKLTP